MIVLGGLLITKWSIPIDKDTKHFGYRTQRNQSQIDGQIHPCWLAGMYHESVVIPSNTNIPGKNQSTGTIVT